MTKDRVLKCNMHSVNTIFALNYFIAIFSIQHVAGTRLFRPLVKLFTQSSLSITLRDYVIVFTPVSYTHLDVYKRQFKHHETTGKQPG